MSIYFRTEDLAVGYNGRILIDDISVEVKRGSILTLIGPNGAGKSTILKTITKQLSSIKGKAVLDGKDVRNWSPREYAKKAAVVLTDRIKPELMSCAEVVAMGRYPYTNMFGKLTPEDEQCVERALKRVNAMDIANQEFSTLSDGQRQRIMLARAICQEPEVIILDEPTAYLDIRYKMELLDILRDMARKDGITVIMSLHEIDLAMKASDLLMCVKGDHVYAFGTPEEILRENKIEDLYEVKNGSYNSLLGSVELAKPQGEPVAFVVGGAGTATPVYRELQKKDIPFATGVLFENDVDFQVAKELAGVTVSCEAFSPMGEKKLTEAKEVLMRCSYVIDCGAPIGELNKINGELLEFAKENGIPIRIV